MKVFTDQSLEFFKKYINTPSASGFEWESQKVWCEFIKPYVDKIEIDNYGTAIGIINPEAEFKVMIEAHSDVVSYYVNYISSDGLIYVKKNGGPDQQIAPSKAVNIHTDNGIVEGIFGWPAIHVRPKDKKPELTNIFIDVGLNSRSQVEGLGIQVGDIVTYQDEFKEIGKRLVAPGFDNKAGGFMIAQVARMIKENEIDLPFGLYIVNASQEEIGKAGAEIATKNINPDVAIITDVTHDTSTPGISNISRGSLRMNGGPILSIAPPVQKGLFDFIEKTANDNNIKYQRKVATKLTGTDCDVVYRQGVTSALISLPMRYMHTTVEMISKNDVIRTTKLIYNTVKNIENGQDFRPFKLD